MRIRQTCICRKTKSCFFFNISLQLAIFGNFDKTKAEPFILEQFSAFRYMVMFTFKNDFLMHQSDAFFDDLRSFLTPEAVSVNISPEQAVLFCFAIRFLMPDISAHVFLITLRSTFLVDCCIAVTKPLSEYDSFKQAFSALEQQMEQRFFSARYPHFSSRHYTNTAFGKFRG